MDGMNLDQVLCLEMDAETAEDIERADYSYIDQVIGDDINKAEYQNFSDEDDDYEEFLKD